MRAIDADKLVKWLKIFVGSYTDNYARGYVDGIKRAIAGATELAETSITYADLVPHGRWKRRGRNLGECSECGEVVAARHRYCPNCGAKMDGGNEK